MILGAPTVKLTPYLGGDGAARLVAVAQDQQKLVQQGNNSIGSSSTGGGGGGDRGGEKWCTYHTAEGHAYLYNPVTGESKWATPGQPVAAPRSVPRAAPASTNPYVMSVPPASGAGAPYYVVNGIGSGVSPYAGTGHYAISTSSYGISHPLYSSSQKARDFSYPVDDMEGAGDELDDAYAAEMSRHSQQLASKSSSLDIGVLTQIAFSAAARVFTSSVDRAIRAARLFLSAHRDQEGLPTTSKISGNTHRAPWGQVDGVLP